MWGFSNSDGESPTVGENTWRFYNSDGELQATVSAAPGAGGEQTYAFVFRLMGA